MLSTLVLTAEATYLVTHVPFCGHATIAAYADRDTIAPDPQAEYIHNRQPSPKFYAVLCYALDA
ncbi:hypothetical protein [Sulfitobacter marinus]|uniref:hypothetical protein n=1 Tax=Sulfitobacter marinus TaxID=394264 RepID=UPI001587CE09|nr:hypothetical protein [Sulfitobacter marinus]